MLSVKVIEKYLDDDSFNAERFANSMALSRTQLYRKLKSMTGKTTTEFIRLIRLQHAARRIKNKQGTISEIAFSVGFSNLSYFSENFKKQFGVLPSDYLRSR